MIPISRDIMINKTWESIDVLLTGQTKESKKSNKDIDNYD